MPLDWGKLAEASFDGVVNTVDDYLQSKLMVHQAKGEAARREAEVLVQNNQVKAQQAQAQMNALFGKIKAEDLSMKKAAVQSAEDLRLEEERKVDEKRSKLYDSLVRAAKSGAFGEVGDAEGMAKLEWPFRLAVYHDDATGLVSLLEKADEKTQRALTDEFIDTLGLDSNVAAILKMRNRGMTIDSKTAEAIVGGGEESAFSEGAADAEKRFGERVRSGELGILTQDQQSGALSISRSMSADQSVRNLERAKRSFVFIKSARTAPDGGADDPTSELSLIYAFVRAIDPESVVREGEVALFMQGRGWIPAIAEGMNKAATEGTLLTDNEKANIYRFSEDLQEFYTGEEERIEQTYLKRYKILGIGEDMARGFLRDVGVGDVKMSEGADDLTTKSKGAPKPPPGSTWAPESKVGARRPKSETKPPKAKSGGTGGEDLELSQVTVGTGLNINVPIKAWAEDLKKERGKYSSDAAFRQDLWTVIQGFLKEGAGESINAKSQELYGKAPHESAEVIGAIVDAIIAQMEGE